MVFDTSLCCKTNDIKKKRRKDPYKSKLSEFWRWTRIYVGENSKTFSYGNRKGNNQKCFRFFFCQHPPSTYNFFICCTLVFICYLKKKNIFCKLLLFFYIKHIIISVCHCSAYIQIYYLKLFVCFTSSFTIFLRQFCACMYFHAI